MRPCIARPYFSLDFSIDRPYFSIDFSIDQRQRPQKIGLIPNRTDLTANHAKRKDRPKKKARGLATLRPAVTLVCAEGGDHAAPADVVRSEKGPDAALAQDPALHMHRRYAEEVAKLDEVRPEGPRELNRWDVALEEAYRLRRFVYMVLQPVNERRETLGLRRLLDGTALPSGSNAVTLPGHGGVPCVGNDFVMGVNSNSDVRVPGNGWDRVMQDNEFVQPCSTISMRPDDASSMGGYQQHMEAMDMYGYDYDRIATINQQLACDVCQQITAQHEYGFQCICNGGVQPTDGNFAGAPLALPLATSYGDDLMNAGTSLQINDPDSQHYLCYPEGMHLQDCDWGN